MGYWKGKKRPSMIGVLNPAKRLGVGEKIRLAKKGQTVTPEWRAKISATLKAKGIRPKTAGWNKGVAHNPETILKIRQWSIDNPEKLSYWKGKHQPLEMIAKRVLKLSGENHYAWKSDRTQLVKRDHNSTKEFVYAQWRTSVFKRDNWMCRIMDVNCRGQLEAHHILGWSSYPELRYEINNGITLCHAHHPKGRAKEKRLAPIFQELVSVSKER